ncbi:MAG: hypothetical protein FWF06_06120 [Symbiobacteriaceae bacterium]|nr:hypothetical protein [Symbiobacteriaceae bacterium]
MFLMEQLVVIGIFAICAATCVRIFVGSYLMATESRDLKNAIILAENISECFKAVGGDAEQAASLLGAVALAGDREIRLYFDATLAPCPPATASYLVVLQEETRADTPYTKVATLTVYKNDGSVLIFFPVAARLKGVS